MLLGMCVSVLTDGLIFVHIFSSYFALRRTILSEYSSVLYFAGRIAFGVTDDSFVYYCRSKDSKKDFKA